jgi:REP element-mobilizing transposase RayT
VRPGALYFVTFRLADSLPKSVLIELEDELKTLPCSAGFPTCESGHHPVHTPPNKRRNSELNLQKEKRKRIEAYLDRGTGTAYLKDDRIATLACDTLKFFDGVRYELHEWVVMPNHIHVLLRPTPPFRLRDTLHSWKLNISRRANQILGRTGGRFWQPESFDRIIRDDEEKEAVRRYIRHNPVKAGLCTTAEQWKYSSASQNARPT